MIPTVLRFIDPNNFQVKKTISVFDHRIPINNLNELEYIKGEIYETSGTRSASCALTRRPGKSVVGST